MLARIYIICTNKQHNTFTATDEVVTEHESDPESLAEQDNKGKEKRKGIESNKCTYLCYVYLAHGNA